jgi:uncharacterized membrane protein YhaH (DUF805 family)
MNHYIKVLENYTTFTGRANRNEYWYFALFNFLISMGVSIIASILSSITGVDLSFISTLYSLAILLPSIAVAIRRMHDVNKSGWFILIPFYNLFLAITKGDEGANKYGPNPNNNDGKSGDGKSGVTNPETQPVYKI